MSVVSEKSMFCYKFNKIKSKHKNKPPTFSLGAFLWSQKESNIGVLHKNSWLLHNETTYLADRWSSPSMRTNPSNKMTKRTLFLICQLVNGMNDFLFRKLIL